MSANITVIILNEPQINTLKNVTNSVYLLTSKLQFEHIINSIKYRIQSVWFNYWLSTGWSQNWLIKNLHKVSYFITGQIPIEPNTNSVKLLTQSV